MVEKRRSVDLSMKYKVEISFRVDGVVKKDDILGAIYGQLEPVIPYELFNRVQDKNRKDIVIHIEIDPHSSSRGITEGIVHIASRLDRYETAIIAAAIELINKVGAFKARFDIKSFENMYLQHLEYIKKRAAELLIRYESDYSLQPDLKTLKEDIKRLVEEKIGDKAIRYIEEGVRAGPDVEKSDEIIIVEGKNDVRALLRAGYKNVISMGGADISPKLIELAKKKSKKIAFLDRDSQGFKNLDTLITRIPIDYIALPPEGRREVEELSPQEIRAALRNLITPDEYIKKKQRAEFGKYGEDSKIIEFLINELRHNASKNLGKIEAVDEKLNVIGVFSSLEEALERKPFAIVFFGALDQEHINKMFELHKPRIVVAKDLGEVVFQPVDVEILTPT